MLKILQILFSIITVAFAGFVLYTKDFQFVLFMNVFLGLTMLVVGLQEFKKNKKITGWMGIGVFVFSIYAAIQISSWIE